MKALYKNIKLLYESKSNNFIFEEKEKFCSKCDIGEKIE